MKKTVPQTDGQGPPATLVCDHCGDPCGKDLIQAEDHNFCCHGCQLVFEMLHDNNLADYYQLENRPGISRSTTRSVDYSFLEDLDILEQLIDFRGPDTVRLRLHLPQIHCVSCVWLLENLHKLLPGIQQSRVNFMQRTASIAYDPAQLNLRQIVETLARIGYAPELQLHQLDEQKTSPQARALYYKLGVAGFAFGNIMLLSFPEYLGLEESGFARIFGYLNLLLSLPVVGYCASDYWQSAYWGLRQKHLNIDVPITIGMLALFGRSVFEILTHTGAGYLDSLAGLVFFLLIGKWFQQRTYNHLSFERDYKSYFPIAVQVKREGETIATPLNKLAAGDTIVVKNEELIPADGLLVKGEARIDYSFVTGESEPVRRQAGDRIYAGGKQVGGAIEISLLKDVSQSYLTQLWNDSAFTKVEAPSTKLADQIGRIFTYTILGVALLTLLYWLPQDVGIAINAFTAVLIVACPCAVALSIPFTYGNMLRWLGHASFFLKNVNVIDRMQDIDTIVFDKTGTLTDTQAPQIDFFGSTLDESTTHWIAALAQQSSHPLSRQLASFLATATDTTSENFTEHTGQGISGLVNGHRIRLGSAAFMVEQPTDLPAGTVVCVEIDGQYRGCYRFTQELRQGMPAVLRELGQRHELFLLSGDNAREAARFLPYFGSPAQLRFRQQPQDKLNFIKELQAQGKKVMMIGDGLNDAGALRQSDVGLVVTEDINNFSPACDGILTAENFSYFLRLLRYVKRGRQVVIASYILAAVYNIIGLSFAVTATLAPVVAAILMPLSSITIVIFGVGLSSWFARRLQTRPVTPQR
jgi:Cu+-exporting ATPase